MRNAFVAYGARKNKHNALINAQNHQFRCDFFHVSGFRHDVVAATAFYSRLLQNVNFHNLFRVPLALANEEESRQR